MGAVGNLKYQMMVMRSLEPAPGQKLAGRAGRASDQRMEMLEMDLSRRSRGGRARSIKADGGALSQLIENNR
jgi:hypothetical protein